MAIERGLFTTVQIAIVAAFAAIHAAIAETCAQSILGSDDTYAAIDVERVPLRDEGGS